MPSKKPQNPAKKSAKKIAPTRSKGAKASSKKLPKKPLTGGSQRARR